jgi:hypothetical protein
MRRGCTHVARSAASWCSCLKRPGLLAASPLVELGRSEPQVDPLEKLPVEAHEIPQAGGGAARACDAGSACAGASRAAPACGSPSGPACASPRRSRSGSRRSGWFRRSRRSPARPRRPPGSIWCPARTRDTVDSLPADLKDTRHGCRAMPGGHELTGVGDALCHSHVRNPFPKISSS